MTHKLALCVIGCIFMIHTSYKNLPIEIYHPPFIAIPSLLYLSPLIINTSLLFRMQECYRYRPEVLKYHSKKKKIFLTYVSLGILLSLPGKSLSSALLDDCALLIFGNVLDVVFRIHV